MEFVAIDVETANWDLDSICQIGLAKFKDGQLVDEWSSLVDPEDYFDPFNVDIHGITEAEHRLNLHIFRDNVDVGTQFLPWNELKS